MTETERDLLLVKTVEENIRLQNRNAELTKAASEVQKLRAERTAWDREKRAYEDFLGYVHEVAETSKGAKWSDIERAVSVCRLRVEGRLALQSEVSGALGYVPHHNRAIGLKEKGDVETKF